MGCSTYIHEHMLLFLEQSCTYLLLIEILICGGSARVVNIVESSSVPMLPVDYFCCDCRHFFYWFSMNFILVIYLLFVLLLVHWPSWSQCVACIICCMLWSIGICRVFLLYFHCIYSENTKILCFSCLIVHMHWFGTCIRLYWMD